MTENKPELLKGKEYVKLAAEVGMNVKIVEVGEMRSKLEWLRRNLRDYLCLNERDKEHLYRSFDRAFADVMEDENAPPKHHNKVIGIKNFPNPDDYTNIPCDGKLVYDEGLEGYVCDKCEYYDGLK